MLRLGPALTWLVAAGGILGVSSLVALATRQDMLPISFGLVAVGLLTIVSFQWPLIPLAVFAALIPIEEVVFIEGLGTISRLAGILFAVTYGVPRIGRLALGAMPPAGWAYLAWATASLGWAIEPDAAWTGILTLLQLFVIAVLVADMVVHRPTIVRPLPWIYSLSAAATAVVGINTFVALGSAEVRAAAIQAQNPAQFAAVLLPAVVFGLYEVLTGDRRILGGAITLVTTAGVVISGTRGAWVSLAAVVLLLFLPQLRPRRQIAAIATMLVVVAAILQLPGVPDLLAERSGTALSSGGAGRTDIWAVGLTIYRSAPILGVGFANFPIAYTDDVIRATNVSTWTGIGRARHNVVVGTLVELGLIGMLLLALFLAPLVVRRGWGPEAGVVQASLASLLVLALFLDILANRKQVWLVIGLATGLAYLAQRRAGTYPDVPPKPGASRSAAAAN